MDEGKKLTVSDLRERRRRREKIVALTAYDANMAQFAEESGVHLVLVGDSVGMTMLGYRNTLGVTLEQSLHHTSAVVRGVKSALVIGDMPFLSYHLSADEALRNAGRYLQEAGADGVKLEGGRKIAPLVERMVDAGIPVLGHIGLLPQRILAEGKYIIKGRSESEGETLVQDALALEQAGVFGIVIEGVIASVTRNITEAVQVPTIGIGAGPHCSGQIQVIHDLLGLLEDIVPRHSKQYAQLAPTVRAAIQAYADDVGKGAFPGEEHSFE